MISFVALDKNEDELVSLKSSVKDIAAFLTDEQWAIHLFEKYSELANYISDKPLIDMTCYDIGESVNLQKLPDFRKKSSEVLLMLLANIDTPPTDYLRPSIKPDSLLLRPFTNSTVQLVMEEFIRAYIERTYSCKNDKSFLIEDRDGRIAIPFLDIYYFESKEKKVFIRTSNEEYGFYDTLDSLEKKITRILS